MSEDLVASLAVLVVAIAGLGVGWYLARQADAAAREVDRLDAEISRRNAQQHR